MAVEFSIVVQDERGRWATGGRVHAGVTGCQWVLREEPLVGQALMWVQPDDALPADYLPALSKSFAQGADLVYTDMIVEFSNAQRALYFEPATEQELLSGRLAWAPFAVHTALWARTDSPTQRQWLEWQRAGKKLVHLDHVFYRRRVDADKWASSAAFMASETQRQAAALRRWAMAIP